MRRSSLKKSVLLSLTLAMSLTVPAFAGALSVGDYTSDSVLTVPAGGNVIDTAGTYNIKNSDKTVHITNGGTGMILFNTTAADTVTVNGNIAVTGSNLHNGINNPKEGTITINGNVSYDIDNSAVEPATGSLWDFGVASTSATNASTLTITGDLSIKNTIKKATGSMSIFNAWGNKTTVNIDGDLYLYNRMLEEVTGETSGTNVLYANHGATINVNGNKAEIYAISSNPDAITAKRSSTINLNSKTNKVVGDISFIEATGEGQMHLGLANGGTVKATFDGADSYWWGDEQNYCTFWKDGTINLGFMTLPIGNLTGLTQLGTLDFTFKNGAEWFYLGDDCYFRKNLPLGIGPADLPVARAKYISAITLEEGGIVNLQDADIQNKLASVEGLLTAYPKLATIDHDFVTIGDLKGSNGIFKLDLNVADKAQSDMIYVEGSTNPGKHYIQGDLSEADLTSLSETNTLRFATVAESASGVSFAYNTPEYDDSLFDYTALVGSKTYDANDTENATYNSKYGGSGNYGDSKLKENATAYAMLSGNLVPLDTTYANGTNWYLYGYTKKVNPVVGRLVNTAVGAYDFALDMDRLNKRQGQAQYIDNKKDGLWVRYQRGSSERDSISDGTYTMGQLGYDKLSDSGHQRFGVAVDYKKGDSNLDGGYGTSEHSRRGITFYDTIRLPKDGGYLDLVARYGKLNNDFKAYRDNGKELSGNYDNHMAALSAEYGKFIMISGTGFFEPQVQLQYAHLSGGSYTTENGFAGKLDNVNSVMGRIGFRLGKETPKSQIFLKADVLHEFRGGQTVSLSDHSSSLSYDLQKRGTWYDVGIGANYEFNKKTTLFADIEKTFGSEVKGWEVNVGLGFKW